MVSSTVWTPYQASFLLAADALPSVSRIKQINIVSPVQEYSDYMYAQRREQRAATAAHGGNSQHSQQAANFVSRRRRCSRGSLGARELQQLLHAGQCDLVAGAARPYLCQCPDQRALVGGSKTSLRAAGRHTDTQQQRDSSGPRNCFQRFPPPRSVRRAASLNSCVIRGEMLSASSRPLAVGSAIWRMNSLAAKIAALLESWPRKG